MKTALITVDPLDDLAALQDKIAWAKAPRTLLMWPGGGCAVRTHLDFVRLRRAADRLGTQIAVITRDRQVRREAAAAGIPAFATRGQAVRRPWRWRPVRLPRHRRRRVSLYALRRWARRPHPWSRLSPPQRLASFIAGVLAVLVLAAVVFPSAEVTLQPTHTTRSADIVAEIAPDYPTVTLAGHLPARWETVTVGKTVTVPVSGYTALPAQPAHAEIVFTNLTDQPVAVPPGTRVRSLTAPEVTFVTTESGTVAAGAGEVLKLKAVSLARGETANRPPHDLRVVEPPLTFRLLADNPKAARRGADMRVPAPNRQDYRTTEATVRAALDAAALAALQQRFPDDVILLPTLQAETDLENTFDPPQTAAANTLTFTLRTRYRALLVARADLKALGQLALAAQAPPDMHLVPASLVVEADPAGPQGQTPPYRWVFHAQAQFAAPVDAAAARWRIAGASPATAARRLQAAFPLASAPVIKRQPSWWPWLPLLPFRIRVVIALP